MEDQIKIYIPSFNRSFALVQKTLKTLKGISQDKICVVCSSTQQKNEYIKVIKDYDIIVSHTSGIAAKRNWIRKNSLSKYIMMIDDDIEDIVDHYGIPLSGERIYALIFKGFEECESKGLSLWGVSGFHNAFYLRDKVTTDLKFIIGNFFGTIQKENKPPIECPYSLLEDYYFSCKHFLRDGGVLRMMGYGTKTKFAKNAGGLQTRYTKEKRLTTEELIIKSMLIEFPSGMMSVRPKVRGINLVLNRHYKISDNNND